MNALAWSPTVKWSSEKDHGRLQVSVKELNKWTCIYPSGGFGLHMTHQVILLYFQLLIFYHFRFKFEHILSDADSTWKDARGYVTPQLLQGYIPDFSKDEPTKYFICVCGPIAFTQLADRYFFNVVISLIYYTYQKTNLSLIL